MLAYLGHFQSGKKPFHVRRQQAAGGYSGDYALDTFAAQEERNQKTPEVQPNSRRKQGRRRQRNENPPAQTTLWEPEHARMFTGISRFAETNLSLSLKDLDPQRFQSMGSSVSLPSITSHQTGPVFDEVEGSSRTNKATTRNILLKTASQVVTKAEHSTEATQKFLGYKDSVPLPSYNTDALLAGPPSKTEKEIRDEKTKLRLAAKNRKIRIKQLSAAASDVQDWSPPEDRLLLQLHAEHGGDWEVISATFAEHREFLSQRKPLELCSRFRALAAAAGRSQRRKPRGGRA
jgi:hypothetical protein